MPKRKFVSQPFPATRYTDLDKALALLAKLAAACAENNIPGIRDSLARLISLMPLLSPRDLVDVQLVLRRASPPPALRAPSLSGGEVKPDPESRQTP